MLATLLLALQVAATDPLTPLEPLSDEALDERRGGFVLGNYELAFGVIVAADGAPLRGAVTDRETLEDVLGAEGIGRYDDALGGTALTVLRNTEDGRVFTQSILLDVVVTPLGGGSVVEPVPLADLPADAFGSF